MLDAKQKSSVLIRSCSEYMFPIHRKVAPMSYHYRPRGHKLMLKLTFPFKLQLTSTGPDANRATRRRRHGRGLNADLHNINLLPTITISFVKTRVHTIQSTCL